MNNLKEKIIEKIKKGEVKMKPKVHFVLKTILLIGLIFLIIGFIIFIISFILFYLKSSGLWYLPRFGFRGFGIYLRSLPWFLIFISLVLIFIVEILAKKFEFVWKRPIFYSLFFIILISFFGVLLLDKFSFHSRIFLESREGKMRFISPIYNDEHNLNNVHRGIVEDILENEFVVLNARNDYLRILVNEETKVSEDIKINDTVIILGERKENNIEAFIIEKIEDDFKYFEHRIPKNLNKRNKNLF